MKALLVTLGAVALLAPGCTRGQVLVEPPAAVPALPSTATVEWDHAWLDRLDAVAADLLAARYPAAVVSLDALLLGDGDVTSAKTGPVVLRFPAAGMEWMDALGQGVGVRVAYGEARADLQLTTSQGVCAARATFAPLWVHLTFAFDPAAPLGALVPVGVPTLVGAEPPLIELTTCPIQLADGLLADLASALQREVRQRVAALQLAFVQGLLDEVFTPWTATGLRFAALGAEAVPLTWWMSLGPASSAWRRDVRVAVEGGVPTPVEAPVPTTRTSGTAPRGQGCLVRLVAPAALVGELAGQALARGLLSDKALLETTSTERPGWLPDARGLRIEAPFRVVAAPLSLDDLDVAAADGGVRLDASGTWRLRVYGRVEGSEQLLGRALLVGAVRVALSAAHGRLVVVGASQGAFSDVAAPVVPLAERWPEDALSAWAGDVFGAELGALLAQVPPAATALGAPRLASLSVTDAGLEACFAVPEEFQ